MLLQSSHFFLPFIPHCPAPLLQPAFPHLSSCLWVIHISSLASPFPILFLTSLYFVPTIYASYSLSLPPIPPIPLPTDNPPCDLHFCDSVPVLVVCFHFLCFFLDSVVDSCEFDFTIHIFDYLLFLR